MKNQSFHPRKIRIQETPELNPDELKDRTIIALNKLGSQKFSDETGGYSLDNWARGVNILLDDFEEKMGKERLPSDYFEKRRELNETLSKPVSTPVIDDQIAEVRQKMAESKGRIQAETGRLESKITELKAAQAESSAALAREKERISTFAAERSSGSFFKRLVTRTPKSVQGSKSMVEEIEAKLDTLDRDLSEQQKRLKSIERHSPDSPLAEDWKTLESLQASLEVLDREKSDNVQLVKIREEFATVIADTISKIPS